MASDKLKVNYCLICSTKYSTEQTKLKNTDINFLLKIIFEISQDSKLLNSEAEYSSLKLCDKCIIAVNQCKQIYIEILQKIETLWDSQNEILEKINDNPDYPQVSGDPYNKWANHCRQFIQHHDFTGFGYPFVVHDLETLSIYNPALPLTDHLTNQVTCYNTNEDPFVQDPLETFSSESVSSSPVEQNNIYDNYQEEKNHSGNLNDAQKILPSQVESFLEEDISQDPLTGKFHCSYSSCSKSFTSKHYTNLHYQIEHLKIVQKKSYPCEWPGCGKIIGDKQTWAVHMDKHRGTPKTECKECGAKFYWRKELISHKRKVHGMVIDQKSKRRK